MVHITHILLFFLPLIMAHSLPELPYPKDALSPHISEETIEYHYGRHHAGYVTKLNGIVAGTPLADLVSIYFILFLFLSNILRFTSFAFS